MARTKNIQVEGIEVVKSFKTTDKKIFENQAEAEAHQIEINREAALDALIEGSDLWGDSKILAKDFILDNWHKLKEIL